jgi:hypothetical protein
VIVDEIRRKNLVSTPGKAGKRPRKPKPKTEYPRTLAAFQAERRGSWEIVKAIEYELDVKGHLNETGRLPHGTVRDLYADLAEKNAIDVTYRTLDGYVVVAQTYAYSTARQRRLFEERCGVSALEVLARADWTPEGIEHQILTGQNLTRDRAHKLTGQRTRQRSDDPEKWNAKDWEAFDHEVVSAVQVITDALIEATATVIRARIIPEEHRSNLRRVEPFASCVHVPPKRLSGSSLANFAPQPSQAAGLSLVGALRKLADGVTHFP